MEEQPDVGFGFGMLHVTYTSTLLVEYAEANT